MNDNNQYHIVTFLIQSSLGLIIERIVYIFDYQYYTYFDLF